MASSIPATEPRETRKASHGLGVAVKFDGLAKLLVLSHLCLTFEMLGVVYHHIVVVVHLNGDLYNERRV